jgi:hypothetical protein
LQRNRERDRAGKHDDRDHEKASAPHPLLRLGDQRVE